MSSGWIGWIPILDERKPERGVQVHRPFPGRPGYTLCGMLVADPAALVRRKPANHPQCGACERFAREPRANAQQAAARAAERADPGGLDRRDRAAQRGTSVRTVSGGQPGLGRRSR